MLSKSQFIRGLQCHKSLWLYRHRPAERTPPPPHLQAIFDRGTDYGIVAQQLFPEGVLVPFEGLSYAEQVDRTQALIAAGVRTIYEATFLHDGLFVKVDILHRGPAGWELYEVKSSCRRKEVFVNDAAVQCHAVTGSGIELVRSALVLMNEGAAGRPELSVEELFRCEDVTAEVRAKQSWVARELARQKRLLLESNEPAIAPGGHCHRPYACDFKAYCGAGRLRAA